jgi:hypothetical protein
VSGASLSLFVEVTINLKTGTDEVDLLRLERIVNCLKALQARQYRRTCPFFTKIHHLQIKTQIRPILSPEPKKQTKTSPHKTEGYRGKSQQTAKPNSSTTQVK